VEFEFIETDIFTKEIGKIVSDAEYGKLQAALIHKPDLGALIPGGQGVRKLRWALAQISHSPMRNLLVRAVLQMSLLIYSTGLVFFTLTTISVKNSASNLRG